MLPCILTIPFQWLTHNLAASSQRLNEINRETLETLENQTLSPCPKKMCIEHTHHISTSTTTLSTAV
jgi:hypothetical protein